MASREFNLKVGLNSKAAESSLKTLNKQLNVTNKQLGNTKKASKEASKGFGALGGSVAKLAGALGGLGLLKSIADVTAKYEDLQSTLSSVTGSTEKGAAAFENIKKFATQTQFGVEDLTKTFIKLKASGIAPTTKLLNTFTDAAAVTSDQVGTLNAITDLFARTTAGGLGLEEINRLTDRGLPALDILKEKLKINRNEISEFGKSAEGAKKIVDALAEGIDERFGGATKDRIKNLSTAMSNFKIAIDNTLASIGKGNGGFNSFSTSLAQLLSTVQNLMVTFSASGSAISNVFGAAIRGVDTAVRTLAVALENDVVQALVAVGIAWKTLSLLVASTPLGRAAIIAASAFVALGQVIDDTIKVAGNMATIGEVIQATFNVITKNIKTLFNSLVSTINQFTGGVDLSFRGVGNAIIGVFDFAFGVIKNGFTAMLQVIISGLNTIIESAGSVAGVFDDDLQASINSLSFENPLGKVKTMGELMESAFNTDHIGRLGAAITQLTGISGSDIQNSIVSQIAEELKLVQAEAVKTKVVLDETFGQGAAVGSTGTSPEKDNTKFTKFLAGMNQELKLLGLTNKERLIEQRIMKWKAQNGGKISADEITQLTALETKLFEVNERKKAAEEAEKKRQQDIIDLNKKIEGTYNRLGESVSRWAQGSKDAVKSVIAELIRLAALKLFGNVGGFAGGFLSGFGQGGSGFGGSFASGGTAPANKVSLVGENGPELIYPSSATTVIPNNKIGGGSTTISINPQLTISGGVNNADELSVMFSDFSNEIATQTNQLIKTQLGPRGVFA